MDTLAQLESQILDGRQKKDPKDDDCDCPHHGSLGDYDHRSLLLFLEIVPNGLNGRSYQSNEVTHDTLLVSYAR